MQIRTIRKGFERLGLGLRLGPWLGPYETTQKWPFLPKNDLKFTIFFAAMSNKPKFAKTVVTSKSIQNRLVN